jgi:hypothetical protein
MKNIQVIDGARNCAYDIFSASDSDFAAIFPRGRDIEFIDDFCSRVGARRAAPIVRRLWAAPIDKKKVQGIHGTLFYELDYKKRFYPTKREADLTAARGRAASAKAAAVSSPPLPRNRKRRAPPSAR